VIFPPEFRIKGEAAGIFPFSVLIFSLSSTAAHKVRSNMQNTSGIQTKRIRTTKIDKEKKKGKKGHKKKERRENGR
jgi:hypothetical protein